MVKSLKLIDMTTIDEETLPEVFEKLEKSKQRCINNGFGNPAGII